MFSISHISVDNDNTILDVAYNYNSTRMAVTFSDRSIKVWNKDKYDKWKLSSWWKSADSAIQKVLWVHEEYGAILVTCSLNNVIVVWQENACSAEILPNIEDVLKKLKFSENYFADSDVTEEKYLRKLNNESLNVSEKSGKNFRNFNRYVANNTKFNHENEEPSTKKSRFNEIKRDSVLKTTRESYLQEGIDSVVDESEKFITETCPSYGRWKKKSHINIPTDVTDMEFAPHTLGLILSICCVDGKIKIYEALDETNLEQWSLRHEISSRLLWNCLSWTNSLNSKDIPLLAAGCSSIENELQISVNGVVGSKDSEKSSEDNRRRSDSDFKIRIFEFHKVNRVLCPANIVVEMCDPVYDVAFAPTRNNVSYHTLAVASNTITVFKIELKRDKLSSVMSYNAVVLTKLTCNSSHVYNLEWGVLDDLLISSGEHGCIQLWKNVNNHWRCINTIKGGGN